ncbi:MAG: hypothetical protein ACXVYB_00175 [Arthrobacter sp.]
MQTIRFYPNEDALELNRDELTTILNFAQDNPDEDIRVHDEEAVPRTNIKVYVGPLNLEQYRYWVSPDGSIGLTEEDVSPNREDGDWRAL